MHRARDELCRNARRAYKMNHPFENDGTKGTRWTIAQINDPARRESDTQKSDLWYKRSHFRLGSKNHLAVITKEVRRRLGQSLGETDVGRSLQKEPATNSPTGNWSEVCRGE